VSKKNAKNLDPLTKILTTLQQRWTLIFRTTPHIIDHDHRGEASDKLVFCVLDLRRHQNPHRNLQTDTKVFVVVWRRGLLILEHSKAGRDSEYQEGGPAAEKERRKD
jgi:hypothetical protein